jgi:ATP-binding cassette subfamily F protein uup
VKLLAGELEPTSGEIQRGATVRLAHLSQDAVEIPGHLRVLESLEEVRSHAVLSDGREITATMLCDRFGFRGDKARTLVGDLSGGERRRLGLMRLMMGGPNVLLLDEPTNDLDIETLTALEDLLDAWPGTLVVVSHDRYFVERVCDDVHMITAGGDLRRVPGGIDQYLDERQSVEAPKTDRSPRTERVSPGATARATRKDTQRAEREVKRLERAIEKLTERETTLHERMAASATDHTLLAELQAEHKRLAAEREGLETSWLQTSESLEE